MSEKTEENPFSGKTYAAFVLDHCSVVSNTAEPTEAHDVRTEPLAYEVPTSEMEKIDESKFWSELKQAEEDEDEYALNDKYFDKWLELEVTYNRTYKILSQTKYEYLLGDDEDSIAIICNMDPEPAEDSLNSGETVTLQGRFYDYYYIEKSLENIRKLNMKYCTLIDE